MTGPTFSYVATASTLTTYSISASTGGLTAMGAPLSLPYSRSTVAGGIAQEATDPSGRFLYVLDQNYGVYAYSIDPASGELTQVAGSPFEAPIAPISLAFDASGSYLFIAGETSVVAPVHTSISAYSITSTGALVSLASYTLPDELSTLASSGNYLYVAGFYSNSITVYSIGPTGALSANVPGSPFATDNGPYAMAIDPSGSVLYTANTGYPTATQAAPGSVSAFTIASTGALVPAQGNPRSIAPVGVISIDPMGRFLFVPEANDVAVYAISTQTAALNEVAGSPFAAGTNPGTVSVDSATQTAYVINNGSASISEFSLSSTGALAPLPGSPVAVGSNPGGMVIAVE